MPDTAARSAPAPSIIGGGALRFYALLGFEKTAGPIGPEPLAILSHPSGVELKAQLEAAGVALSGGLMRLGPPAQAIFVRDPDRNVIELHQRLAR